MKRTTIYIMLALLLFACSKKEEEKSAQFTEAGANLFYQHYDRQIGNRHTVIDSAIFVLEEAVRLDPENTEAHYFLAEALSRRNFKADEFYSSDFTGELNYFATRTAHGHYMKAFQEDGGYSGQKHRLWPWEKLSTEWGNIALGYLYRGDSTKAIEALRDGHDLGGFDDMFLEFSRNYLLCAPDSAILITDGDMDTYGLLYLQLMEGFRRDVSIVNLSLLNMDGYIRYQRDIGLPIPLTDEEIDSLAPYIFGTNRVVYIYDKVLGIIDAARKRPLAFTVNVSPATLGDYDERLSLEGLVYRVTSKPGSGMDLERSRQHFLAMSFEHLPERLKIPGNGSIDKVALNYGTLGIQIGSALLSAGRIDDAIQIADIISEKLPWSWPTDAFCGQIYAASGRPGDVERLWKRSYKKEPDNARMTALFMGHFQRLGMDDKAREILNEFLKGENADSLKMEIEKVAKQLGGSLPS